MNHNMLVDYLPETVEIEGTEYAIETNFRTFILFEMMMQDPDLSDAEKARQGLELVYPEIPENLDDLPDKVQTTADRTAVENTEGLTAEETQAEPVHEIAAVDVTETDNNESDSEE